MKMTQPKDPAFTEECDSTGLHPAAYFFPPFRFVEPDTEGRLIEPLRNGARIARTDTMEALVNATLAHLDGDPDLAFALADLTVSGRVAFALFKELQPSDVAIISRINAHVDISIDPSRLENAVAAVLERAYRSLWIIRHRAASNDRNWIAVWAEIDPPHRPVNVPGTRHTQFDITVPVRPNGSAPSRTINTRFAIFDNQKSTCHSGC